MSQDHSGLVSVARALWGLQSVYGDIPNTLAQGRSVRKLLNMVAMFNHQFGQPPTKQVGFFKLPNIAGHCCGSVTFCILARIRIRGSVLLTNGFSSETFKMATKNYLVRSLFAYYFLKLHLHHFSKIKSYKEVTKQ
jgi:hypothetical protein